MAYEQENARNCKQWDRTAWRLAIYGQLGPEEQGETTDCQTATQCLPPPTQEKPSKHQTDCQKLKLDRA